MKSPLIVSMLALVLSAAALAVARDRVEAFSARTGVGATATWMAIGRLIAGGETEGSGETAAGPPSP